jgi:YD repeat-containing protein
MRAVISPDGGSYPYADMAYANPDAVTTIANGLSTTTFSYDADGNVTQKTVDGTTTTYVYDYANRLIALGSRGATTTYGYDAFGQRVLRIAEAVRTRPVPSLDDIRMALAAMPIRTVLERRDRAVIAFTLASGARDNAIASFSLKHIDIATRTVFHDARDVRTKNAKTFTSTFFPVGGDIEAIVAQWIGELAAQGFEPDDPVAGRATPAG